MTPDGIESATFRFVAQNIDNFTHPKLVRNRIRFSQNIVNLLAPELFFLISAQPVYKMLIIQEPNMLEF